MVKQRLYCVVVGHLISKYGVKGIKEPYQVPLHKGSILESLYSVLRTDFSVHSVLRVHDGSLMEAVSGGSMMIFANNPATSPRPRAVLPHHQFESTGLSHLFYPEQRSVGNNGAKHS